MASTATTTTTTSPSTKPPSPPPPSTPPSWFQIGTFGLLLLLDGGVATLASTTFSTTKGSSSTAAAASFFSSYADPGSVTWDICLLGYVRVVLLLITAFGFDAYALSPKRTRRKKKRNGSNNSTTTTTHQHQQQHRATGAGISPSTTTTNNKHTHVHATTTTTTPSTPSSSIRRLERWLRRLALWISIFSVLAIVIKCLVRLIVGIGPADSMAGFWVSVAASVVFACVDYVGFKGHLRHVKRWAYHRHREELLRRQGTLRETLLSSASSASLSTLGGGQRQSTGNGGGVEGVVRRRSSGETSEEDDDDLEEVEDETQEDREDAESLHELWAGLRGLDPSYAEEEAADATKEGDAKKGHASYKDLLSLVRDDTHLIALAFVFLLGAAVGQVMIPHYTGQAIDAIVSEEGKPAFQRAMLMLVMCAAICGICTGLRGGIFTVVGARVNRRIRYMLFQSLLRQEIGFYDVTKTGDISSRLSADTTKVGDQVSLNVNFFLRNLVQAIGTLLFMFLQSWRLSLLAFVSVPAIVVISKFYGQYIRKLSKLTQEKLAAANAIAEECLSTMSTVRSFACEDEEGRLYKGKLDDYYFLNKQEARAYGAYAVATTLLPNLVTALVLFYGGQLVLHNDGLTSGELVAFLLLLASLSDAFNNMGSIFSAFTQALGAADKVFELIRRQPKTTHPTPPPPHALAPPHCRGDLELRDIIFKYPARPLRTVLQGLSLQAKPGQVVALVGPSGGGKSSCVALLERHYEPESGQVLLDGQPVCMYDAQWFHRHVSIVAQEPVLYARSIRANIIFGLEGTPEEPSEEEIRQAAVKANCFDFITALPEGFETEVGERGVCLSGGQKQRIAIARALCRKPRVLLLDEATSALDQQSEALVQRAIDHLIADGGMTVLIIAHRLSTVINADVIYVVKDGQVVEAGRHSELLAKKSGVYAQLVAKQVEALDVPTTTATTNGNGGTKQP